MSESKFGLIGAGQMARALARGFVARELVQPEDFVVYDPEPNARSQFSEHLPAATWVDGNVAVVNQCDVVLLAIKPQTLPAISRELGEVPTKGKLFISILAGVPIAALTRVLRTDRVVRVMPNTPALIGHGAAAFALGSGVKPDEAAYVEQLLSSVGLVHQLPERLLDAVTGLSGSGPAYVYMVIEALSDGGVRMGLPRSIATALAAQTVLGAAQMVLISGEHPSALKDRVASPAGTTIAGLQVLERRSLRSALIDAVEAATIRSQELGAPD